VCYLLDAPQTWVFPGWISPEVWSIFVLNLNPPPRVKSQCSCRPVLSEPTTSGFYLAATRADVNFFLGVTELVPVPVRFATLAGAGVLYLLAVGCSHAPQVHSHKPARSIVVDGADTEWGDRRYLLEQMSVTIALANDDEALYLCVATSDRMTQTMVVRRGLELWLDPKAGTRPYFGVRLPGVDRGNMPRDGEGPRGGGAPTGAGRRRGTAADPAAGMSPEGLAELLDELATSRHVLILDATQDEGSMILPGSEDPVQARLGFDQGRLVYEARLPLLYHGVPPFELGQHVGLVLRLPAPDRGPRQQVERADFDDGRGDGLGGRGGSGGRRGRGPGFQNLPAEPLEQWVRVQLQGR